MSEDQQSIHTECCTGPYLGMPNNVKEPVAGRACLSTSSDIPAWIDCTDFAYLSLMDVATRVYIFQYMS